MVVGDASRSVAEGGVGQIAEGSSFSCPFLNCLLNPGLVIVILNFLDFDTVHDSVDYVENGWFELWVMGTGG